jgi:large subunit ribosomal protein L30
MSKIRVTQTRSGIGRSDDQRRTLRALGLRRIGSTALHDDSPVVRGMVFKVKHLVAVKQEDDAS